jgi:hypothetical protein
MLTSLTRFMVAADVYLSKLESMVKADKRSPGTLYTYQQQLRSNVLPRIGEIRLGEATTPLSDKVITARTRLARRQQRPARASFLAFSRSPCGTGRSGPTQSENWNPWMLLHRRRQER